MKLLVVVLPLCLAAPREERGLLTDALDWLIRSDTELTATLRREEDQKAQALVQQEAQALSGRPISPLQRDQYTNRRPITNQNYKQPKVFSKRRLLMPVIISSYSSTNIQGHGVKEVVEPLSTELKSPSSQAEIDDTLAKEVSNSIPEYEDYEAKDKNFGDKIAQQTESKQTAQPIEPEDSEPTKQEANEPKEQEQKEKEIQTVPELEIESNDLIVEESPYLPPIPPSLDQGNQAELKEQQYQLIVKDTKKNTQELKAETENKDDIDIQVDQLAAPKLNKPAQSLVGSRPAGTPSRSKLPGPPSRNKLPGTPSRNKLPGPPLRNKPPGTPLRNKPAFLPNKPEKQESSIFDFIPFLTSSKPSKPLTNPLAPRPQPPKLGRKPLTGQKLIRPLSTVPTGIPRPTQDKYLEKQPNAIVADAEKPVSIVNADETARVDVVEPAPFIVTGKKVPQARPSPPPGFRRPPPKKPLRKPLRPANRKQAPFIPQRQNQLKYQHQQQHQQHHQQHQQQHHHQKHQHHSHQQQHHPNDISQQQVRPQQQTVQQQLRNQQQAPRIQQQHQRVQQQQQQKQQQRKQQQQQPRTQQEQQKQQPIRQQQQQQKRPQLQQQNQQQPLRRNEPSKPTSSFSSDKPAEETNSANFAAQLSSLLTSLFTTTSAPPPLPSLPTLVEDILSPVPSLSNKTPSAAEFNPSPLPSKDKPTLEKAEEPEIISTTSLPTTTTASSTTTASPEETTTVETNDVEIKTDLELDSLSAPKEPQQQATTTVDQTQEQQQKQQYLQQQKKQHEQQEHQQHLQQQQQRKQQQQRQQQQQQALKQQQLRHRNPANIHPKLTTRPTITIVDTTTTTTTFRPPTTTLSSALQNAVDTLTSGAVDKPSPAVLKTLRQDFEQKKNIFKQFVVFGEEDSPFLPNSEVYNSDWSRVEPIGIKNIPAPNLGRSGAPADVTTTTRLTPTTAKLFNSDVDKFPSENNAEGGFRPMLRPLHSPLLDG